MIVSALIGGTDKAREREVMVDSNKASRRRNKECALDKGVYDCVGGRYI